MQLPPLTHTIDGVAFTFIHVPEGFYLRGKTPEQGNKRESSPELPLVEMDIAAFYLQQTPVTVAQYSLFVQDAKFPKEENEKTFWKPERRALDAYGLPQKGCENHPMQNIGWYGAATFANWLSQKMEYNVRLPTEAEWEYATKGGHFRDSFRYAGDDNLEKVGWYDENSDESSQAVKQKKANRLGLHDLSGNVWEWCADRNHKQKGLLEAIESGPTHVLRGGSWDGNANYCRTAYRYNYFTISRDEDFGLRCAISPI